jgi:hypothetical protein
MTTVVYDLQKFIRRLPMNRSISNALRSESFASWSTGIAHAVRGESLGRKLRCGKRIHHAPRDETLFSSSGWISDAMRRKLPQRSLSMTQGIRHAARGESRGVSAAPQSGTKRKSFSSPPLPSPLPPGERGFFEPSHAGFRVALRVEVLSPLRGRETERGGAYVAKSPFER